MSPIQIVRVVPARPEQVFAVVGDLASYGAFMPLTTVRADSAPIGPGWTFRASTGWGVLAVPDRMQVTRWAPPNGFGVVKLGPVLDGWAEVEITAEGEGSVLVWREEVTPRPARLGALLAPVSDRFSRAFFGRAVDAMIARIGSG